MADDALSGAWQALARTVPNHVRHASWEALASASAQQGKNFVAYMVMENCLDLCISQVDAMTCLTLPRECDI
jgi:hypothetical protein